MIGIVAASALALLAACSLTGAAPLGDVTTAASPSPTTLTTSSTTVAALAKKGDKAKKKAKKNKNKKAKKDKGKANGKKHKKKNKKPKPSPSPQPQPTQQPGLTPTPTPGVPAGPGSDPVAPPTGARTLWVHPTSGNDDATGAEAAPLRTVAEAWRRIPRGTALTQPVWVMLRAGVYPEANTPHYWEERRGTLAAPIVLASADGARTAVLRGDINAFQVSHLTLYGIAIDRAGDTFHCEQCSYVTLNGVRLDGRGDAHETVKVNQSDHITIINSQISGAYENAIDFVAVQHSAIQNNTISDAGDWCAYVKGGSAYALVSGNRIHHCGTGGFTAGQGTGFEFMVPPWLGYETYGVTVMNNIIHDTEGAGLGVNGGYNTVMAHNTMYRVGARSHVVEFVHGSRSCDGDTAGCQEHRALGGWGGAGIDGQFIPSRHTYFLNNVVLNPPGYASQWQHFQLADPVNPPNGSGVPAPSRVDDDLVIKGNVISNGGAGMSTGLSDSWERAVLSNNRVNTMVPDLVDPAGGDFRPRGGGALAELPSVGLPAMTWADVGVPAGTVPTLPANHPPGALRAS